MRVVIEKSVVALPGIPLRTPLKVPAGTSIRDLLPAVNGGGTLRHSLRLAASGCLQRGPRLDALDYGLELLGHLSKTTIAQIVWACRVG